jgi:hypothetical protein
VENKLMHDLSFNFKEAIMAGFNDSGEAFLSFIVFRQSLLEAATFFKLSSIYNCDSAVDIFVLDQLENEYRFTIIYSLQSSIGNYTTNLITKTKDGLAIVSLQSIFPGFNLV